MEQYPTQAIEAVMDKATQNYRSLVKSEKLIEFQRHETVRIYSTVDTIQ